MRRESRYHHRRCFYSTLGIRREIEKEREREKEREGAEGTRKKG